MNTKGRVNPELIQNLALIEAATSGGVKLYDIPADRKLTRYLRKVTALSSSSPMILNTPLPN